MTGLTVRRVSWMAALGVALSAVVAGCGSGNSSDPSAASSGCKTDIECKGGRICVAGSCVDAGGMGGTAQSAGGAGATGGGKAGTGGAIAKGGSGGSSANGGAPATGGAPGAGGGPIAGGTSSQGGATGTGGAATGTGGGAGAASCATCALHPGTAGKLYCPFANPTSCGSGEHCCVPPTAGSSSTCIALGLACDSGDKDFECEDPATDCPAGNKCCGAGSVVANSGSGKCGSVGSKFTGTHCAASCGPGEVTICESNAQCPSGSCVPFTTTGVEMGACDAPSAPVPCGSGGSGGSGAAGAGSGGTSSSCSGMTCSKDSECCGGYCVFQKCTHDIGCLLSDATHACTDNSECHDGKITSCGLPCASCSMQCVSASCKVLDDCTKLYGSTCDLLPGVHVVCSSNRCLLD